MTYLPHSENSLKQGYTFWGVFFININVINFYYFIKSSVLNFEV